ncbi:MAG: hypothetical protein K2H12_02920, partial [Acetatifactor sp.]|nr:hypothetical protein [Acetatifactor sp.]
GYHLRDAEGRLYSDQFEVHIIELNKELIGDRLDDWIRLLRVGSMEDLDNMHSGNAGVTRAIDEVRVMNLSRRLRAWYDARQRDQRDRWAIEDAIKEDAYKEGHETGKEIGEENGKVIGQRNGRRQDIMDLLEDWGEVPGDIRDRIYAEEDTEVLRKWHKAAARAEGFDDFRAKM